MAKLNFRALTIATAIAKGLATVERPRNLENPMLALLMNVAGDLDSHYRDIETGLDRIKRDAENAANRLENFRYLESLNAYTVAELDRAYAAAKACGLNYAAIYETVFGMDHSRMIHALLMHADDVESPAYDRNWLERAAGIIGLAEALINQAEEWERSERDRKVREAEAQAAAEKAAKLEARRAARKAAKG